MSKERGTVVLAASDVWEAQVLREIATTVVRGSVIQYQSRDGADHGEPYDRRMTLKFLLNGREIVLRATRDEDEKIVRSLRDWIWFGKRGGVLYLEYEETLEGPRVRVAPELCKICRKPVASLAESEWQTCDACAEKCKHEYKRGTVHGGVAGPLAMGEYCGKCGRGKPESIRPRTQAGRELEVQKETGIIVQYKGMPGVGPAQVVKTERTLRRLEHARARARRA
ncbi:MAG: hypothetical protein ACM3NH_03125 [Candidatus Saccharibacteria bacterium]